MDIKDTTKAESEIKNDLVDNSIKEKHKKTKKHHQHHPKRHTSIALPGVEKESISVKYEANKMIRAKKESKLVEVIDKEKFNSLRELFEKKNEKSKLNDNQSYKLSLESNLATFTDKENVQLDANSHDKSEAGHGTLSEGIKKRMENLFNSNKNKQNAFVDPVLEHLKIRGGIENNDDEEDSDEEDDDDVVYSENSSSFDEEEEKLSKHSDAIHKDKNGNFDENQANINDDNSNINNIPALYVEENEHIFNSKENLHKDNEKIINLF